MTTHGASLKIQSLTIDTVDGYNMLEKEAEITLFFSFAKLGKGGLWGGGTIVYFVEFSPLHFNFLQS
jgi:hypothetical protein